MLIIVLGRRGSGKTLWMVLQALKSKRDVWSNFEIKIDRYNELRVVDLIDELPNNCEVLIDEAYTWLESRTAGRGLNRYLTYLAFQIRKAERNFIISAQQQGTIDVRFRKEWDYMVYCFRKPNRNKRREFWDFGVRILDKYSLKIIQRVLPYESAEKYFRFYDTYEVVEPFDKQNLRLELMKDDPKRLHSHIKQVAGVIEKDINKITHSTVSNALLKNGFSRAYHLYVYDLLKGKLKSEIIE
ncbi:MAG: hypothetical protein ACOC1X_00320 [Promethearchaeota archaeon]